jgi:hypothetical protein
MRDKHLIKEKVFFFSFLQFTLQPKYTKHHFKIIYLPINGINGSLLFVFNHNWKSLFWSILTVSPLFSGFKLNKFLQRFTISCDVSLIVTWTVLVLKIKEILIEKQNLQIYFVNLLNYKVIKYKYVFNRIRAESHSIQ